MLALIDEMGGVLVDYHVNSIRCHDPKPIQELRIDNGKDSHRGPKIRGKGKKAYRGSL